MTSGRCYLACGAGKIDLQKLSHFSHSPPHPPPLVHGQTAVQGSAQGRPPTTTTIPSRQASPARSQHGGILAEGRRPEHL